MGRRRYQEVIDLYRHSNTSGIQLGFFEKAYEV